MEQNKTVIPGVNNDPYSRNSAGGAAHNGTVVPGMNRVASGASVANRNDARRNDPVVGFLFSISRQGIGEYWPVYIGTNTIGRNCDNDICLREGTVSGRHAVLNVRVMKTTGKVIASIRDVGSKRGIFLNDEELGYDQAACKNDDLITIGDNYKLLLIIVDAEAHGLSVAADFNAVEEEDDFDIPGMSGAGNATNPYDHNVRPADGTVALDGSPGIESGHTRFVTQ